MSPDRARTHKQPRGPRRWSAAAAAVALLTAIVFGSAAVVTLQLKHLGERGVQA